MPRAEDIARIEAQIQNLQEEVKGHVSSFNTYAQEVLQSVREVLREAGVLDEVDALEKGRNEVRATLQEKIKEIQAKANDLLKVREYLLSLPAEESTAPVQPVVETPVQPVVEAPVQSEAPVQPVVEAPAPKSRKASAPKTSAPKAEPKAPAPVEAAPKARKVPVPPKF